jgi:nucleotide-binding universal stress UspA family protein
MSTEAGLLVIGDDGSPGADVAWLWVSNHRWPGWSAEVLTATEPPFPPASWESYATPVEWRSPHRRALFAESGLASVRHLTTTVDPRVLLSDRGDATLLVVGASGAGHLRALLTGSTTEWLLQHPPAPLVIARSAGPVQRVLACVDGSEHAQRAVQVFADLPWADETQVTVLSVTDDRAEIEAGRRRALETLRGANVPADALEARGRVTPAVLQHIEDLHAQLVVLGSRGLTGWERLRLGSTAGAVARAAPCTCLVAHVVPAA